MANSTKLSLPLVAASQAQKHVTVNETFLALDIIVQLNVLDRNLAAPPGSPVEGDAYIVASSPTGAWAGKAGQVAAYQGGGWVFYVPREGWNAWVRDENVPLVYDGTNWLSLITAGGGLTTALLNDGSTVALLGINGAIADTTNRLSVNAVATLLNHAGAGHQLKLNKAAPGETVSLLYQTAFSGRAEIGLAGGDDFSVKVSPDGTAWTTALAINGTTGAVALPQGAVVTDRITGTAVTQTAGDATADRVMTVGAGGLLGSAISYGAGTAWADITNTRVISAPAVSAQPTDKPNTGAFVGLHLTSSATRWAELVIETTGTSRRTWVRTHNAGVTEAWDLLFGRSTALGTASNTGASVTGALGERGTSANGNYERRFTGWQNCTRTDQTVASVSTADGALFESADITWTFPAAFLAGTTPIVTINANNSDVTGYRVMSISNTAVTFRLRARASIATTTTIHASAVGRWSTLT